MSAAEHTAHLIINELRALAKRDGISNARDWKVSPAQLAMIVRLGPHGGARG